MNPNRTTSKLPSSPGRMPLRLRLRPPARYALAACACAALVACGGGGGGTASVGTGGTGSFAVGSINGLGSISVNGLRFDTQAASVTNANAPAGAPALSQTDLQLGMTVAVVGDLNPNTQRGTASSVVIAAELKGAITAVGPVAGTLAVLGRQVHVTAATVYAGNVGATPLTGLAQLLAGHVVEVYGLPQPDGSLRATRIEFEAVSVAEFIHDYPTERFHVEGLLTNPTGTSPARMFDVAGVPFRETPASPLPPTLANNTEVTVSFAPVAGTGPFDAVALRVESRAFPAGPGLAEIEGAVSAWDSEERTFTLQGWPVRLGAGVEFEGGVELDLADNVRVEVYGNIVGGVLVATKVEFEDEDRDPFEFAGLATCSPSPCAGPTGSFTLRGVTIEYDATTRFDDGLTRAALHGTRVEVYAKVLPAAAGAGAGTRFMATRVARDD